MTQQSVFIPIKSRHDCRITRINTHRFLFPLKRKKIKERYQDDACPNMSTQAPDLPASTAHKSKS